MDNIIINNKLSTCQFKNIGKCFFICYDLIVKKIKTKLFIKNKNMAKNNNIAQGSSLENILNDQQINERDLKEIENLKETEKKLLKSITKEMLEKWYTIQNKKSFEVFQKMYQIAYWKTSWMFDWKKIEWSKIWQVTVLNEKNKNEDIKIRSVTVWRDGTIYIFSSNNSYSNRIIQNGIYYPNSRYSDNNSEFNDNEVDKSAIRRAEITEIYETYIKELEKIYQAYELINATWKNKIKEILENVKNNKKWFIEHQTNSNQTIDEIKAKFQKRIENLKNHFRENNWKSIEEVINEWINTPQDEVSDNLNPSQEYSKDELNKLIIEVDGKRKYVKQILHYDSDLWKIKNDPEKINIVKQFLKQVIDETLEINWEYDDAIKTAIYNFRILFQNTKNNQSANISLANERIDNQISDEETPTEGVPADEAPAPAHEQTWTNSIKINQAWAKNQILTYKENFDYEKPTKQDIIDILAKYKDADFSKKENIPENSALVIYAIQLAIKELWYANDLWNIDGIFWQKTIEALKKLQEKKLWFTWEDIDGIPWPKTIQAMIEKLNAPA